MPSDSNEETISPGLFVEWSITGCMIEMNDGHELIYFSPRDVPALLRWIADNPEWDPDPDEDLTALEPYLEIARAQSSALCAARGPTPEGSAGVKAEAKRSPEGCLDAEASEGHCAPTSRRELKRCE
jgi:hypothetical protein